MNAVAFILVAASPEAQSLATQIAKATLQPDQVIADALAQFSQQFEAGVERSAAGRAMTSDQLAKKDRVKAAAQAELSTQLRTVGLPRFLRLIETDYAQNFTEDELREAAAFWLSPAGKALTTAMQNSVKNGSGQVVPPAEHGVAIGRYMASAVGRKESGRSALVRPALAREMSSFMQEVQPKIDARMKAAMAAAS